MNMMTTQPLTVAFAIRHPTPLIERALGRAWTASAAAEGHHRGLPMGAKDCALSKKGGQANRGRSNGRSGLLKPPAHLLGRACAETSQETMRQRREWAAGRAAEGYTLTAVARALGITRRGATNLAKAGGWTPPRGAAA